MTISAGRARYPSRSFIAIIPASRASFAVVRTRRPFSFAHLICARLIALATPRPRARRATAVKPW